MGKGLFNKSYLKEWLEDQKSIRKELGHQSHGCWTN